jgi:D-alanyl-D-alanine carboxypeptidase
MFQRSLGFITLLLCATTLVQAQYSVGKFQAVLALLRENPAPNGTGVALLIRMPDGSSYRAAVGLANIEDNIPIKPEDPFRIGSLTKTFTAVLTLQLVDQGVLLLEDPLAKWLPPEVLALIPNHEQITIRHLLNHTSGIFNYVESPRYRQIVRRDGTRAWTALDTLQYVADRDPYFAVGTGWHYSNSNYNLLQLILERASGQPIARLLQTRIVDYLGLPNTRWETAETLGQGVIRGYMQRGGQVLDRTLYNDGIGLAGYAGIISTADDLATFLTALFDGRLLSPAMLREMQRGVATTDEDYIDYGLGVYLNNSAIGRRVGHTGRTAGFSAQMWYLPDQRVSVVIFANHYQYPVPTLNDIVVNALQIVLP